MIGRDAVDAALARVVDPCSSAFGTPVDIVELGLVTDVELDGDHAGVTLRLTGPGCHFAALIAAEAEERLLAVPGVATAHVRVADRTDWSESDLSPAVRDRLAAGRDRRRTAPRRTP